MLVILIIAVIVTWVYFTYRPTIQSHELNDQNKKLRQTKADPKIDQYEGQLRQADAYIKGLQDHLSEVESKLSTYENRTPQEKTLDTFEEKKRQTLNEINKERGIDPEANKKRAENLQVKWNTLNEETPEVSNPVPLETGTNIVHQRYDTELPFE